MLRKALNADSQTFLLLKTFLLEIPNKPYSQIVSANKSDL
jgi:hypothetical protein